MTGPPFVLAVALDGGGHHPAAEVADPFDAGYWARLAAMAERGGIDLVTVEDTFGAPRRRDPVTARPDAALVAARVAPLTRHVGLVPVITTTHTEPFHVASITATLDHISHGRAGWQPRVSVRPEEADLVGARPAPSVDEAFAEAAEVVDVVRRLWDSWEDDAIVKDVATGRYVDRDKLHFVDFEGGTFSVKGPSIVPRPPQGQPVVAVLAHVPEADDLAARGADLVFVTPAPGGEAARVAEIRAAEGRVGRSGEPLRVVADLVVFLDRTARAAAARRDRLDERLGREWRTDAAVFTGTDRELAELMLAGREEGLDGWRLRPGELAPDLAAVADGVANALRTAGARPPRPEDGADAAPGGLRARLGLPRPASRYAGSGR
jgi:alkanesulfonate monooxygenase SsuD/methylene tetrahydromethanopterin reductase-like flavin-dependent oxidoreductase (luciferase family)